MVDWESYFDNMDELVEVANKRLTEDKEKIRYVNMKVKLYDQPESKWYFEMSFQLVNNQLIIAFDDGQKEISLPAEQVEYIKLRPFYYAACIGFKAFVLHPRKALIQGE